jgi:hypothetical protein
MSFACTETTFSLSGGGYFPARRERPLTKSFPEGSTPIPRRTETVGPTRGLRSAVPEGQSRRVGSLRQATLWGPEQVLEYLARYTYRVAISNRRLISLADGRVTFEWKDYATGNQTKTMTLEAVEFIRRFLLHVPPPALSASGTLGSSLTAIARKSWAAARPPLPAPACIYLDTYMLCGVYEEGGICIRNHCGAEPPRDIKPPGLFTTVGWRDRAPASYAAANRVKAPASAARRRFRGIHGGRTAPSLPAET